MRNKNTNNQGVNGRWTKTEHQRFLKGLERYGKDWVSVQKIVKTRNLIQVRSHAQKVFQKMDPQQIEALIGEDYQFESFQKSETKYVKAETKPTLPYLDYQNQRQVTFNSYFPNTNLLLLFKQALQRQGYSFQTMIKNPNIEEEVTQKKEEEPLEQKIFKQRHQKETSMHQDIYQCEQSI